MATQRNTSDGKRPVVIVDAIYTIGEMAGLPVGTRIATNHNKLLICGEFAGGQHWYEEGELTNHQPLVHWLPVYVLPPVMERTDSD